MFCSKEKKEIIKKYKISEKDTGSIEIQIGFLSERIKKLAEHFKKHKKDFHSNRGLLMIVSKRKKLLNYLKKNYKEKYLKIMAIIGKKKKLKS